MNTTAVVFDMCIPPWLLGLSLVWMRSWQSSSTEIPVNGYWSLHRGQIKMFSQEKKRRHKKRLFHSIRSGISWKLLANARSPRGNMNLLRGFIAETCIRNWLLDYYYQMHVYTDSFPHTNILYKHTHKMVSMFTFMILIHIWRFKNQR